MKTHLTIRKTAHGHWYVSLNYYNKQIAFTTTNSVAIDDYNSDELEKDGRELKKLRGFRTLRNEVVRHYKNSL